MGTLSDYFISGSDGRDGQESCVVYYFIPMYYLVLCWSGV